MSFSFTSITSMITKIWVPLSSLVAAATRSIYAADEDRLRLHPDILYSVVSGLE